MNTPRKVILTLYVILGAFFWIKALRDSDCGNWNPIFYILMNIVIAPLLIYIILGIPTFIIYKIWGDKKKSS